MHNGGLVPQNRQQMLAREFCDVLVSRNDP
jgi:hypothetical protein